MMQVSDENRSSSVDENEIAHFDNLAKMWWNKITPLHTLNQIRVPLVRDALCTSSKDHSKPLSDNLILEIGCGVGIFSEELAKLGGIIHAIDPSPEAINVAKRHASLNPELTNLTYCNDFIEKHALSNSEKYDVVIASEVLEHVTDKEMFLEACVKCLKPGGMIFITTFNKTFASWLISIIIQQEILNVIPRGTHTWDKFISPEDVSKMLNKLKCKTVETKGYYFNAFTTNWTLCSSLSTTYALHAVKQN